MFSKMLEKVCKNLTQEESLAVQVVIIALLLSMLSAFLPGFGAHAELIAETDDLIIEEEIWEDGQDDIEVILEDPEYIITDDASDLVEYIDLDADPQPETVTAGNDFDEFVEEDVMLAESSQPAQSKLTIPVITSVGKANVKVNGVISRGKLIRYTIPEKLLADDPTFLALMVEAEKYIGYPYVYGESNPKTGFDCSGFVCWVFMKSGVYNTGRHGANGLHSMCTEVDKADLRPGDLVFFKGTMGRDVKGITHVGIYVGNNMMIHAGDPVGFADLSSEKWRTKINCYGRLPID